MGGVAGDQGRLRLYHTAHSGDSVAGAGFLARVLRCVLVGLLPASCPGERLVVEWRQRELDERGRVP